MKQYPHDNQAPLKMPFQPIAIVCQLGGRVIGAFSVNSDLCELDYKELTSTEHEGSCQTIKKWHLKRGSAQRSPTYHDLFVRLSSQKDDF